jgi:hypothetical protein
MISEWFQIQFLSYMSKWFTVNKLALNVDKTNIIKFVTNNLPQYAFSIAYDESVNTKFLVNL